MVHVKALNALLDSPVHFSLSRRGTLSAGVSSVQVSDVSAPAFRRQQSLRTTNEGFVMS